MNSYSQLMTYDEVEQQEWFQKLRELRGWQQHWEEYIDFDLYGDSKLFGSGAMDDWVGLAIRFTIVLYNGYGPAYPVHGAYPQYYWTWNISTPDDGFVELYVKPVHWAQDVKEQYGVEFTLADLLAARRQLRDFFKQVKDIMPVPLTPALEMNRHAPL